ELMSQYGEPEFIDRINYLLTENNFEKTSLIESGREIVFLIMKTNDQPATIPLFAKISLQTVKRNLETLGFKVSWALIDR
ncbi:MAG: TIGR04141 family sporadically distributed protein, partial [Lentilactobacillus hilgardii]|uniref:TIGR04141 family sporadically distributed protein n=1 Tax=Lentilactobacillus hilgardii TaxID=1588 RepID=UPI0039E93984